MRFCVDLMLAVYLRRTVEIGELVPTLQDKKSDTDCSGNDVAEKTVACTVVGLGCLTLRVR
jgi:hypothetical protein